MTIDSSNTGFSTRFDSSIYGVTDHGDDSSELPKKTRLNPVSSSPVISNAELLLNPESTHQVFMNQWLRPSFVNSSVMRPIYFTSSLRTALRKLESHSESNIQGVKKARVILSTLAEHRLYVNAQLSKLLDA